MRTDRETLSHSAPSRTAPFLFALVLSIGALIAAAVDPAAARDPATHTPQVSPDDAEPNQQGPDSQGPDREDAANSASLAVKALQQQLVAAIARAEASVVSVARIRTDLPAVANARNPFPRPFGGQGVPPTDADFVPHEYGAGIVLAPKQVLTTYHTLGDPANSQYVVWSQQRPLTATLLAADPWFDLAVLEIVETDLKPIQFGEGGTVQKGQFVAVLGNPQGLARDGRVSAAQGIISNLLRRAPRTPERSADSLGRETVHHYGTLLQVNAALPDGYQGGAVINLRGEMIGFLTSLAADPSLSQPAGLAIPVDEAFRRVVKELQAGKKPEYGFLGVAPEPVVLGLRRRGVVGAMINRVIPGTPAAVAGLRDGDFISHIDQRPVSDDDDLIRLISVLPPETVTLLRVRRGDPVGGFTDAGEIEVKLAKKAIQSLRPAIGMPRWPAWRGLQVDYATAVTDFEAYALRIARFGGVVVTEVQPDSLAEAAGLQPGDFLSHVDDVPVATPVAFHREVANHQGDPVELQRVDRQGRIERSTVSP